MKFLSISRWLVNVATSLHLVGLKAAIKLEARKVSKALRFTDISAYAHKEAAAVLAYAKADLVAAKSFEVIAKNDLRVFMVAAKAEADTLRRSHTVGA